MIDIVLKNIYTLFAVRKYNSLDFVELVQCFNGCKVVDVQAYDFVAYLRQYRVVELEERKLNPFPTLLKLLCRRLSYTAYLRIVGFQFF